MEGVENEEASRAGEHSDTDDEDGDGGVVLLHHQLLQSLQSTTDTPLREQSSLITQLRADPQLMRAVVSHRRHQRQGRIRDESTQTENDNVLSPGKVIMNGNAISSFPNTQKLIDVALSNPIILDKVFDFHASSKTLRLVCKSWNNIILSGKPRLSLNLNHFPYGISDEENQASGELLLQTRLDPKLFKSITLSNFKNAPGEANNHSQIPRKLIAICEKFGSNILHLCIIWSSEIIPTLYKIFGDGDHCCQNIKTLSISLNDLEDPLDFLPIDDSDHKPKNPKTIFQKSKLKTIAISSLFADKIKFRIISNFFQDLLLAAPKLEKLAVESFSCPGLKTNKELKWLQFHSTNSNILHKNCDDTDLRRFNVSDLSSILQDVKGSLLHLELSSSGTHLPCDLCFDPCIKLELPPMPKLQVFINRNCEIYKVHLDLPQLGVDKMPSLSQLIFTNLHNEGGEGISRMRSIWYEINGCLLQQDLDFGESNKICIGVKTLGLIGLDLDMLSTSLSELKRITFPHLKNLHLLLPSQDDDDDQPAKLPTSRILSGSNVNKVMQNLRRDLRVGGALKSCCKLELHSLRVEIRFSYGILSLTRDIWDCRVELFSGGLKILEIINNQPAIDDLTLDEENQFKQVLILTKGMQRVVFGGFLLRGGFATRIVNFISDNKLPVEFVDFG